jgi:hypothetical protein
MRELEVVETSSSEGPSLSIFTILGLVCVGWLYNIVGGFIICSSSWNGLEHGLDAPSQGSPLVFGRDGLMIR